MAMYVEDRASKKKANIKDIIAATRLVTLDVNIWYFVPRDTKTLGMILKKNGASLLYPFKLCAFFQVSTIAVNQRWCNLEKYGQGN